MNVTYITKDQLRNGIRTLRDNAEEAKMNAGYMGSFSDGGHSRMMEIADTASGLINYIPDGVKIKFSDLPDEIRKSTEEYIRDSDPEYIKYLELKDKFES